MHLLAGLGRHQQTGSTASISKHLCLSTVFTSVCLLSRQIDFCFELFSRNLQHFTAAKWKSTSLKFFLSELSQFFTVGFVLMDQKEAELQTSAFISGLFA